MKVVILGGGQVGATLAANLASEVMDITVVDVQSDALHKLQEHYDIQTIQGRASHPDILRRAGVEDCDLLIAVTNSDEVNMIACQIAFSLFRTPLRIARIRSLAYLQDPELFEHPRLSIDVIISPESVVTEEISGIIDHPGALQVLDFAGGQVYLIETVVEPQSPLAGHPLKELEQHLPGTKARVAAIYRQGEEDAIIPTGDTLVQSGDNIFFMTAAAQANNVLRVLHCRERPYKRLIIAGGGGVGEQLALNLEKRYSVKLIETRPERCNLLAESLKNTVVLCGNATDIELLHEENISHFDIFCAVTNDDANNIMSSLLAKRLGVGRVMTLINKPEYAAMFEDNKEIDLVFSPREATISTLLSHVRRGGVVHVHSVRRGNAEVLEAVARGSAQTSSVVGRSVGDIPFPDGTTLCAIVRREQVIIPHRDVVIESDDHIVFFLVDKQYIQPLEQLFLLNLKAF